MHDLRYDAHAPDERTRYDMPTVKRPPAQAFAQLRQQFGAAADAITDPNERYSSATIAPPIDQCPLNMQVDYWSKAIHEAAQRLREISVKMQEAA